MACDLQTTLAAACTSGIGKLQSRIKLLQAWAQLLCSGASPVPPCTVPPPVPVMLGPSPDGSANYTLSWTAVPGATSYLLDIGEPPAFAFYLVQDEPVIGTSFVVADVADALRMTRVRAVNACGISDYSNTVNYFTFLPSDIAGLEIWAKSDAGVYQDAAKTVPCTTTGDRVYTWENFGNTALATDFTESVLGSRPTYNTAGTNGKPKLVFATSQMRLIGSIPNPFTIAFVVKNTSNSATAGIYIGAASANPHMASPSIGGQDSTYVYSNVVAPGNLPMNNVPGLQIADFPVGTPTAGSRHQVNTANSGSGGLFTQTLIDPTLGNYNKDANYYMNGDFYEVCVYNTLLSAADILRLNNYFDTKYALPF